MELIKIDERIERLISCISDSEDITVTYLNQQILILDQEKRQILEEMESTMRINRCLEDDHYCSRNATAYCNVRNIYKFIQADLESKLSQLTLEKMLSMGNREAADVIYDL